MNVYKFTETDYNIEDNPYFKMLEYYTNGGKYTKENQLHIYKVKWDNGQEAKFSRINSELMTQGYKKVMGWVIDFRGVWNKYLINAKYHGWIEVYAPSKMAIRDNLQGCIIQGKIIELD